jgi:broad specificity phosphatase PhoE
VNERTTLLLVRHAPTAVTRAFRFPLDEELDDHGRAAAGGLLGTLRAGRAVTSPSRRCRETAAIAGFPEAEVEPDLAELDFGSWAGQDPHDLWQRDPERLEAWYRDPASDAPDGGETFDAMQQRVVAVLEGLVAAGQRAVVFTHGGPIKAAVLHALGAPPTAMWRLDVAPCSVTELHGRPGGGFTLASCNVPPAVVAS